MTQIGSTPQIQPNIIQNSPQDNAQKAVRQNVQAREEQTSPAPENKNFQKLAEDILAKRASGDAVQKPAIERGQVIDLLI